MIGALFSQSTFINDTIRFQEDKNKYILKNSFIYPESINISIDDKNSLPDSVDYVNGIIYWNNSHLASKSFIVTYEIINKNLPLIIGPLWKDLPDLDLNMKNKPEKENYLQNKYISHNNKLYTSGTFNRQINIATNGMSEFTGGLNLNISGELDNNIMLSAVLSDQDMLIQPEGNTRNLEDIDQVYIALQHPNFSLDAGDIKYKNNISKLINIERNVIGINNNFKYKNFSGNGLISTTRGKYMSLDINGIDGVQGPYDLMSKESSKDISLISGSEKVWLDGEIMTRGANYDYVIDYSLAEITFTAKNLIHFDSDILLEYEYVDGLYTQKITSGTYKSNLSKSFDIVTGFMREKDNANSLSSDSELYQKIANGKVGDLIINGAVTDSTGDYYLDGDIFIYDPNRIVNEYSRYKVTFTYNARGNYEKIISDAGQVYYQYYDNISLGNKDLYSPYQKISGPQSKDLYYAIGSYNLGDKISISTSISNSIRDNNILSGANKSTNGGLYEFRIALDSIETEYVTYTLSANNLIRDKNYSSVGLDRNAQYKRHWDLDSIGLVDESEFTMNFFLGVDDFSRTSFKYSGLDIGLIKKDRIAIDQKITSGILTGTNFQHQRVSSDIGDYEYTNANIISNFGYFSPFFRFREETKSNTLSYDILGGGLNYQKENRSMSLGIDKRKDKTVYQLNDNQYSEDFITSLQYNNQNRLGWKNNIILKKRIKKYGEELDNLDYVLGRMKMSYKRPSSPIYFELNTSTERTQNENYSIVYDSIGVGLGEYRYDRDFNAYIRDPNGSYISYTIPSGQRVDMININGFQKIVFDLQKIEGYPFIKFRMNTNYDYSGKRFNLKRFIKPVVSYGDLYRSYIHNIIEVDWNLQRLMDRFRAYNIFSYDLQGYDPRGNDLFENTETGLDCYLSISKNINLKIAGFSHSKNIESDFISIRNRNIFGSWYQISMYTKNKGNLESDVTMRFGGDRGRFYADNFNCGGLGFEYNARFYLGQSGSIQTNVAWQRNKEDSGINILPPEALNGLTIGENININSRVNYFLKKDISLSLSISYIDNYRYKNLITVLGEFRAYL